MTRDESTATGRSRLNVSALVALVVLLGLGAFAVTLRPARTNELVDAAAAQELDKFSAIDMVDAVDRVASASRSDSSE